jgi:hypothetical protein
MEPGALRVVVTGRLSVLFARCVNRPMSMKESGMADDRCC